MSDLDRSHRVLSRRSFTRGAAALGAASFLPLPSVTRAQDAGKITFWVISSFTPDENAAVFKAANDYKEATGVEVVIESTAANEIRDKLTTAVLGGQGPDVVSVDSAWNAGLAASGITSDISSRFGAIADQFFEGPAASGSYLGKQYAVPWYTNNVGMYYNKKMLNAASVAPPTTWDELVSTSKALTSGDQYGLMMGASGFGAFTWFPFAFQNEAQLISDDGKKAEFDSEAGLGAWQYYSDLYLTHKVVPEDIKSATTAWDQVFAPFIQERVAMLFCGDWATFAINSGNPDIEFAVAPLPVGKVAATVIGGYNLAIPPTSSKADLAWDFIQWMTAQEQEWILQSYNRIQARADIVDTEYASSDPILKVFVDQSSIGRARATVPQWGEIEQTILANAWDSVVLGQASPADALAKAASDTNSLLAES